VVCGHVVAGVGLAIEEISGWKMLFTLYFALKQGRFEDLK
jgi:hypothetical protein